MKFLSLVEIDDKFREQAPNKMKAKVTSLLLIVWAISYLDKVA